ncbi:MAG: Nif3-like dinuclear metal center hexameric protein [Culicoidibacterales bacterium]
MAKKTLVGQTLIKALELRYPKALAMEKDPIGLQLGSLNKPIKKILVALDVDQRVCDEAVAQGVDLIIAHHPFIYMPLQQLQTDTPKGKMIAQLIKHDISVYAAHTNLDIAKNGLNDWLASRIGLLNTEVLSPTTVEKYVKFSGYVPTADFEAVRAQVFAAVDDEYFGYRDCSFASEGIGSFTPLHTSQPVIGTKQELNLVAETKLEMRVPQNQVANVIKAYQAAHPYEVPAYETVILEETSAVLGLGRIGTLAQPMHLADFVEVLKTAFNLAGLRIVGAQPQKLIQSVAVLGGSGSSYWRQAKMKKADIYLTGDVGYHDAQEAVETKMMIADIGHYAEHVCKEHLHKIITEFIEGNEYDAEVIVTLSEADPFEIW